MLKLVGVKVEMILVLCTLIATNCATTFNHYRYGQEAFANHNYEQAIMSYSRFLETDPQDERKILAEIELSKAYFNLGELYYSQGDYQTAKQLFYSANTDDGDKWIANCELRLAELDFSNGQYEEAIERLDLVINSHYNSEVLSLALFLKIEALWKLNKEYACLDVCRELNLIIDLDLPEATKEIIDQIALEHLEKGDTFLQQREFESAIEVYSAVDEIPSSYKQTIKDREKKSYLDWALDYEERMELEVAINILERAENRGFKSKEIDQAIANNKFLLLIKKGDLAYETQEWQDAKDYYSQALKYNSKNSKLQERLTELSERLKFINVYDFENGNLVKKAGYRFVNSFWDEGNFIHQYESPRKRTFIEVTSDNDSKNSLILSFSMLILVSDLSNYFDEFEWNAFFSDATRGAVSLKTVSDFIINTINRNETSTKLFANYKITVSSIPTERMVFITME
jgi:tetratricopeptide (TPR) repeat protein